MDKKLVVTLFAVVIILLGVLYFAKGGTLAKDSCSIYIEIISKLTFRNKFICAVSYWGISSYCW